MTETNLRLPIREGKPRESGITVLIDNGAPFQLLKATVDNASDYIDFIKFGWGTSLLSKNLQQKINYLIRKEIDYFFGGTLFEKFLSQEKVEAFYDYCRSFDCSYVEISNGTLAISNHQKAEYVREFSRDFSVFSEVGTKDSSAALKEHSKEWLSNIHEDIEAGAAKVITEARESGSGGICGTDGSIRDDIFDEIVAAGIPMERLIFEAPTKSLQTFFIKQIGSNVNLANVALNDVISLETLRLGLRSDTFHL
ncbi:phosphosulfolactate synthase [Sediminibacillus dalangtanensis]|uniref:Phosphosulfolactate synthase n=1 Tax=Sediminibacillus dalangtanensis TaxID=2729421 RepID=A0ABX7VPI1_9BACI|nr:phosphosulfolactate synthase [Sediminibacillus dalangtanensis]QTM98796.1 phosphosulfolactate synthase [Sediminibacillus dalangtanensis]